MRSARASSFLATFFINRASSASRSWLEQRVDQLTWEDAVGLEQRPASLEGVGRISARGRQLLELVDGRLC